MSFPQSEKGISHPQEITTKYSYLYDNRYIFRYCSLNILKIIIENTVECLFNFYISAGILITTVVHNFYSLKAFIGCLCVKIFPRNLATDL